MEFLIEIKKQTDNKQLEDLKKYLDRAKIEQLKSIKIKRAKIRKGEMSGGKVLSTLAVIVKGTVAPVSGLFTAIINYSASRKTDLIIKKSTTLNIIINTLHRVLMRTSGKWNMPGCKSRPVSGQSKWLKNRLPFYSKVYWINLMKIYRHAIIR